MAVFEIEAVGPDRKPRIFLYDSMASTLAHEDGRPVELGGGKVAHRPIAAVSKEAPGRKETPTVVKIQLGLGCNYACQYCSQRFVPHAQDEGNAPADVRDFLESLPSWFKGGEDGKGCGTRFEFWGGEPFVYWRKLKPLAEAIRDRYPNAELVVITNGSLLDEEKNRWLDAMGFRVGISHDGPGQIFRGPDPLDDPGKRAAILDLYRRLHPQGRISFNAMLHARNLSRGAVLRFFQAVTGDDSVQIGELAIIDAYDDGGKALSLRPEDEVSARRALLLDLAAHGLDAFPTVAQKVRDFLAGLRDGRPGTALGQKCGMDRPERIAVDLKGRVVTCQNVSAESRAPNGRSHRIGDVADLAGVRLDTATHWSHRPECRDCPVVQLCKGSCMFLEGDLFEVSCRNAYADNVAILAHAFRLLTGLLPVRIVGPHPAGRHSLWE